MGACDFTKIVKTEERDMRKAFIAAVQEAKYDHGHAGYSGTLAEKNTVIRMGEAKSPDAAHSLAYSLLDDSRVDDKWGPAGAIEFEDPHGWVFFGWASS